MHASEVFNGMGHLINGLLVLCGLHFAQATVGRYFRLVRQIADDRTVGFKAAQDIGAD